MIRTLVAKGPFTLLLSSVFLFVQADSTLPPLPTEEDFLGELPVVLSVTRLAQPLAETPASVTIIDREMIEASGARNIAELFRLVPGMQVGSWNGHAFSVTYHGLSDQFSRRMQVLVDGRSVYSPDIGGVRWSYLPLALDDIARIEVIRGPNAATYGANSFLGVISISTRQTAEVSGSRITLNRGEDDIADVTLRHAGAVGEVDYRFTLGYQ
ncbi:MAG: Plug domain-containing protein, partial [Gammaproteobacteria bacterium]|nr:Plug domain-containing protein [Gammaproteobacteria bacterium]